jgi:hypothetical protein
MTSVSAAHTPSALATFGPDASDGRDVRRFPELRGNRALRCQELSRVDLKPEAVWENQDHSFPADHATQVE